MKQYYIYDGNMRKGPFDLEQLKSQSLNKETPIWYEGLENWAMAGNINELQELFDRKIIPPPFSGAFEKKETSGNDALNRNEVLNSFADAEEIFVESKKKSLLLPVIILIIITGIIITYFVYH